FCTASGSTGAGGDALLRMTADDKGGVSVKEVYLKRNLMPFHGGAVRVGKHVYGAGGVGLVCLELETGEVKWRDRSIGRGSVLVADGRIYLRGESGKMALADASPE